jgi:hypothetical protein
MLHSVAGEVSYVGVVEDGAEMFAMSVACWYVVNLFERRGDVPTSLWQRTKTALARPSKSGHLKNEAPRFFEWVELKSGGLV